MAPEKKTTLLIKNAGQVITMAGEVPRLGNKMNDIGLVENGGVAIAGEDILAVGKSDEIEGHAPLAEGCTVIDAEGAVITPGLIDPHTHPVFSKTRLSAKPIWKSLKPAAVSGPRCVTFATPPSPL